MCLEFMHAAGAGDHSEIEDAAVARLQRLAGPNRAPTIFGQQLLTLPVELAGIGDRAVDILAAQHLAAIFIPGS